MNGSISAPVLARLFGVLRVLTFVARSTLLYVGKVLVTAFALGAIALCATNAHAGLTVTATKTTDGTGTCTLDASQSNGLLCTNDEAEYKIAYAINPPPSSQTNVTLTLTIPAAEPFRFSRSSGGLAACANGVAAISADGKTVTCVLGGGAPISNLAGDILFSVVTTAVAKNGDVLAGVTAKIVSTEDTNGSTSVALGVTVLAQPQLDLYKTLNGVQFGVGKPTGCVSAGTTGILVDFLVGLNLANVKGHEALANGWTYVEEVASVHPNACIYDVLSRTARTGEAIWPPAGAANPDGLNTGGGTFTYTAGGSGNQTITANNTNTSGDIVGIAAGYNNTVALHYVRIWVANEDASSTTPGDPCTLSGSNEISVAVTPGTPPVYTSSFDPVGLSGASNLGGAIENGENNIAPFGPRSLCSGGGEKLFTSNSKGLSKSVFQSAPRMSNEVSGPNDYIDTYTYWTNNGFQPRAHSHCDKWDNRKLSVDLLDPALHASDYSGALGAGSAYRFKSVPPTGVMVADTTPGYSHIWVDSPGLTRGPNNTNGEIEFGFVGGGVYTDQNLRSATCNDADSAFPAAATGAPASGWVTQTQLIANPTWAKYVNAIRMKDIVIPPGGNFQIFTHLQVLAADPFTNAVWPDGTIVPNYWSIQTDATGYGTGVATGSSGWLGTSNGHLGNNPLAVANTGNFCTAASQPATPGAYCDDAYVDRLRLATESVSVRKGIFNFDPTGGPLSDSPVVPKNRGDIFTYQLWPRISAKAANVVIDNDLILVDTLPAGLKYVAGSAKFNGVALPASDVYVQDNAPAASTLKFRIPNIPASTTPTEVIPALEFDAEILLDDPLNQASRLLVNEVVIDACQLGATINASTGAVVCNVQTASQSVAERTATRTIRLAQSGALIVQKRVIGSASKEIESSFTMGLRYLNAGSSTVGEHRLIDILPYNGEPDRGNPSTAGDATKFSGARPLTNVVTPLPTNYQVFYTNAAPASIDANPKCPSNTGAGPGVWPLFAPGVPPVAGCTGSAGSTAWTLATGGPTWTGFPAGTTAILVVDKNDFTTSDPSREVTMTFPTTGSRDADRYSNNVSAANGGLGTALTDVNNPSSGNGPGATFNTFSNNVTVRVFAASIQGTVFIDPDGNGATTGFSPPTDTGLPGVTVKLNKGGLLLKTAMTAAADIPAGQFYNPATGAAEATASATNVPVPAGGLKAGQYLFADLVAANDYEIVETQPTGYSTTGDKAGNGATPGTVTTATDTITAIGLSAGQKATGYDFGEGATTSVAGRVYVEKNGNTADDGNATDTGIGGVSISMTYTPPGGGAAVTVTTTTNADGTYSFLNIPVGSTNAVITETQPSQYSSVYNTPGTGGTQGNNSTTLSIGTIPAAGSPNNNFAETLGSVSGKVYNQATNAGFPGETITLSGTDAAGNPVSLTTTTDANGNYTFTNVPMSGPSGYLISQPNQPAGSTNQPPIAGSTGGTATNPTGTSSQIATVQVSPAAPNSTGNNFPETVGTTVSGLVYIDAGNNGTLEPADTGRIGGVTVTLYAANGITVIATKQTNPDGTYAFTAADGAVEGGNYIIRETQPTNYGDRGTNPGAGNTTPTTNEIVVINVPLAGSPNNNFGEIAGSVAGRVYNQGTNVGYAGETVTLTGTDAAGKPVSLTTTTDASGNYVFKDVPLSNAAGYTVTQPNQPAGSTNVTPLPGSTGGTAANPSATSSTLTGVRVSGNTAATLDSVNNNFPESVGTTISGLVYVDTDRNGALSAADPARIGGVTVQLLAADGVTVLATKQTAVDGTYSFGPADGVTEGGTFFVRETQPAAYGDSATNPGTAGTTPSANLIRIANVPAAGSPNNNFGEVAGSVAGNVTNSTTSTPIPGQTITLTGTDAGGNPVSLTATTDAAGNYSFPNVPVSGPTGYTVTQPNQPPGTSNGTTTAGTTGGTATSPTTATSAITGVRVTGTTPATLDSANNNFAENSIIDLSTSTSAVKNSDGTGTFTVVTNNVGTQPAPNVRVTTQLPPGLVGVVVSNGGTYNPTTGVVTWPSIPNIAPGTNVQYTITVPLPTGAVVNAQTTASSFETPASTTPLAEATLANNPSNALLQESPQQIPTLNAAMLAFMALMLAGIAGWRRRRS
jgi:SdrD B-like domain/Domain of unknown function DUF11